MVTGLGGGRNLFPSQRLPSGSLYSSTTSGALPHNRTISPVLTTHTPLYPSPRTTFTALPLLPQAWYTVLLDGNKRLHCPETDLRRVVRRTLRLRNCEVQRWFGPYDPVTGRFGPRAAAGAPRKTTVRKGRATLSVRASRRRPAVVQTVRKGRVRMRKSLRGTLTV